MTKDHFLLISYGTKWPFYYVDVPLNTYPFIPTDCIDAWACEEVASDFG